MIQFGYSHLSWPWRECLIPLMPVLCSPHQSHWGDYASAACFTSNLWDSNELRPLQFPWEVKYLKEQVIISLSQFHFSHLLSTTLNLWSSSQKCLWIRVFTYEEVRLKGSYGVRDTRFGTYSIALGQIIIPCHRRFVLLASIILVLIMKLDSFFFSMFERNSQWPYNCGILYWHGTTQASSLQWLWHPSFILPSRFLFSLHFQLLNFPISMQVTLGVASFGIITNNIMGQTAQRKEWHSYNRDLWIPPSLWVWHGHTESGRQFLWMKKYQVTYINWFFCKKKERKEKTYSVIEVYLAYSKLYLLKTYNLWVFNCVHSGKLQSKKDCIHSPPSTIFSCSLRVPRQLQIFFLTLFIDVYIF